MRRSGLNEIVAKVVIPTERLRGSDKGMLRASIIRDLVRKIAEGITPFIEISERNDNYSFGAAIEVVGRLIVEDPSQREPPPRLATRAMKPPEFLPPMGTWAKQMSAVDVRAQWEAIRGRLEQEAFSLPNNWDKLETEVAPKPSKFFAERLAINSAQREGKAAAIAKTKAEKEIEKNTKTPGSGNGSIASIQIAVRKIQMPEKGDPKEKE